MSHPLSIRWLLVEFMDNSLKVINVRAIVQTKSKKTELSTGKLIMVNWHNCINAVKIVMTSDDRRFLEEQARSMRVDDYEEMQCDETSVHQLYENPQPGPSHQEDYSCSSSSWIPDGISSSESDDQNYTLKTRVKMNRTYARSDKRSSKNKSLAERTCDESSSPFKEDQNVRRNKVQSQRNTVDNGTLENTSRYNSTNGDKATQTENVSNVTQEDIEWTRARLNDNMIKIEKVNEMLRKLAPMFDRFRNRSAPLLESFNNDKGEETSAESLEHSQETLGQHSPALSERSHNESILQNNDMNDTSADEDKKVVTNNSDSTSKKSTRPLIPNNNNIIDSNDKKPIGSGNTYVPKSIYGKINWKSYSTATRKLLIAVFDRKVLATHSLTGKSSPAFMNKPPKLRLDPRKVSDIIMTVTSKCKVKENLVRNVITTKCADENKMWKMRCARVLRERNAETASNRVKETLSDEKDEEIDELSNESK